MNNKPVSPGNIVAFSGVHGTGKTTAVLSMAHQLKIGNVAKGNVGVIQEISRLCPLPVMSQSCGTPSEAAQQWIFSRQLQAEIEASSNYGIVVSDRTLVDSAAYTRYFKYDDLADAMEAIIASRQAYRVVFYRTIANNPWCLPDGFRNIDSHGRELIEKIMIGIYERLDIKIVIDRSWLAS